VRTFELCVEATKEPRVEGKITVLLSAGGFGHFGSYCAEKSVKKNPLIVRLILEHTDRADYRTQGGLPLDPRQEHGANTHAASLPGDRKGR